MSKLFYGAEILEHANRPIHWKEPPEASIKAHGSNASCGDSLTLYMDVKGGMILNASFTATACAVAVASCDMMIDRVVRDGTFHVSAKYALNIVEAFERLMDGTATEKDKQSLGKSIAELESIRIMPSRKKCALLAWKTMKNALNEVIENE